jgi:hypothetical protein
VGSTVIGCRIRFDRSLRWVHMVFEHFVVMQLVAIVV